MYINKNIDHNDSGLPYALSFCVFLGWLHVLQHKNIDHKDSEFLHALISYEISDY